MTNRFTWLSLLCIMLILSPISAHADFGFLWAPPDEDMTIYDPSLHLPVQY